MVKPVELGPVFIRDYLVLNELNGRSPHSFARTAHSAHSAHSTHSIVGQLKFLSTCVPAKKAFDGCRH